MVLIMLARASFLILIEFHCEVIVSDFICDLSTGFFVGHVEIFEGGVADGTNACGTHNFASLVVVTIEDVQSRSKTTTTRWSLDPTNQLVVSFSVDGS